MYTTQAGKMTDGQPTYQCDVRRGTAQNARHSTFCAERNIQTPATHYIHTLTDVLAYLCDNCAEEAYDYSGSLRRL